MDGRRVAKSRIEEIRTAVLNVETRLDKMAAGIQAQLAEQETSVAQLCKELVEQQCGGGGGGGGALGSEPVEERLAKAEQLLEEHVSVRPRGHEAFRVGDAVLYMSGTHGVWALRKVLRASGSGRYEIEAKPGCPVSQESLKAMPSEEVVSPQKEFKFAVGQRVIYMGECNQRGMWFASPTVILAVNSDGTFEIEAKKGARVAASLLFELAAEN